MNIRPIRTGADDRQTLAEIEGLMDATMGTSDGDRLDVLATLVEAYETAHPPVAALDPMIRALTAVLDIPADVLIQPCEIQPRPAPGARRSATAA